MNLTRLEIFRAGNQTSSQGAAREFTEADLDKTAKSYNPAFHEAPIVIGHPEHDAPAWGWVEKVYREGKSLYCDVKDVTQDFMDLFEKKMFKKRSVSLYPDLSLRHVGFLGAQPPAVKGLKDYAFADGDRQPMEFMDWQTASAFKAIGRLFQGMRDRMLADKKDIQEVDQALSQYDIDQLKTVDPDDAPYAYNETLTEDPNMAKTVAELEAQLTTFSEKLTTAEGKATSLQAELATEKGRTSALEAEVASMKKESIRKEHDSFCERMIQTGKMLRPRKAEALVYMESIAGLAAMEFSEGEGASAKTVKKTPLDMYKAQIEAGPQLVTFREVAHKGGAAPAQEDEKLVRLTEEKMKASPDLTYSEASRAVLNEHPELNVTVEI